MSFDDMKSFIWNQIMWIWYNPDIPIDEKMLYCNLLSDYMNKL